jgi:DNA-binding PadR family transcriptional regulator
MLLSLEEAAMSRSTQNTVLGMLRRRPGYGYALVDEVGRWQGPTGVAPAPRAVYKALQELSADELIQTREALTDRRPQGPSRRRYAVTPEGVRRYETWLQSSPDSFNDLFRRIATAQRDDLPALLTLVIDAEHRLIAQHRELRAPEVATLLSKRASWEAVAGALLASAEYNDIASKATFLRDVREAIEELLEPSQDETVAP